MSTQLFETHGCAAFHKIIPVCQIVLGKIIVKPEFSIEKKNHGTGRNEITINFPLSSAETPGSHFS